MIMKKTFLLLAILGIGYFTTNACTRVVYKGEDNLILTARSMDWKEDIKSNIWVFPRGMDRDGAVGPNSLKWKSKYGSVITSAYDISSTDGINEKGLVGISNMESKNTGAHHRSMGSICFGQLRHCR